MFKLILALVSLGLIAQISGENVPAFIFGGKTPAFLPTLQHVSGDEFVTLVKSQADKDTLTVVFVENKLSVEDFSQCKLNTKTCFENLRKADKTYLSSVEHPVDSLIGAFGDKKKSITVGSDSDLTDTSLNGEKILFVYLDDVDGPEDFSKHDELMNKLLQQLQSKYSDVIAIYTGIHPSFKYSESVSRHRRDAEPEEIAAQNEEKPAPAPSTAAPPKQRPRQLEEEVEEIPYIFVNDGHVLLALRKVNITNKKTSPDQTLTLEGNTFAMTVENATEDSFIAVLTSGAHKLSLETSQSAGTWKINFRYNDNVETNEKFHARTSAVGYGPDWSFGCGELYVESFDHEIVLIGFQFQPFFEPATENLDSRNFTGRVSDCVGYFSPGIWGALFVIIILVSILSYGLTMMMDIKTMDKFDDPKGKTIIVNAQD